MICPWGPRTDGNVRPAHAHLDHAVYVLEGGKLHVSAPGREPEDLNLKADERAFLPAQAHPAQNIGDSRVRVIVSKLKPATTPTKTS